MEVCDVILCHNPLFLPIHPRIKKKGTSKFFAARYCRYHTACTRGSVYSPLGRARHLIFYYFYFVSLCLFRISLGHRIWIANIHFVGRTCRIEYDGMPLHCLLCLLHLRCINSISVSWFYDHGACVDISLHEEESARGHWLCWMSTGRKNGRTHTLLILPVRAVFGPSVLLIRILPVLAVFRPPVHSNTINSVLGSRSTKYPGLSLIHI